MSDDATVTEPLATVADYTLRHGAFADTAKLEALLGDASSLVRRVARLHISAVDGDVVTLYGDGSNLLLLPEIPVVAVGSVVVDGVAEAADDFKWRPHGSLRRSCRRRWPCDAEVVVTYDHGDDPVEDWIVALVCSTVQRATRPTSVAGVQGQTTGSQNIQYATSVAGVNLWLTRDEQARLEALRGPVLG